jgi:hypothetical protein
MIGISIVYKMKNTKINNKSTLKDPKEISRREAMTRMGLTAFSVGTMLLLLNKPEKVLASSDTPTAPGTPDPW